VGIFDDASMATTMVRVRDLAASVSRYREKLGLEPIHVGADRPDHPIAIYAIAGSVVSLWQLPAGKARTREDNDRKRYMAAIVDADLEPVRQALMDALSGPVLPSPNQRGPASATPRRQASKNACSS
jgi:catechol 2,3-dioxygenase-like lactoylglutathione lyase family enzyme